MRRNEKAEQIHLREAELADRWRLSQRTLQRWRQLGRGPRWVKLCGRIVYPLADVIGFENAGGTAGAGSNQ